MQPWFFLLCIWNNFGIRPLDAHAVSLIAVHAVSSLRTQFTVHGE